MAFPIHYIVIAAVVVVALAILIFIGSALSLWFQSVTSGATVNLIDIIMMRFRKVNPTVIVTARITAVKAGVNIETKDLEAHYLAGGRVPRVVAALINASKANIPLSFDRACAIDLAGRDILAAVQTSVNPKVIDVPSGEMARATIDGIAGDGIQLKVKARVTVRTALDRLVGGATEETIIARVGEGIVTTIGSSASHMMVLENPDRISKTVLARGLDAGTAFEILSIDIADIDVGENIGARLRTDKAEADKKVAQAEAEQQRARAVAREQEMSALVVENRAKVVLAEAEVPLAMAEAFRSGRLGVMDYYNMKNVVADTEMRTSIANPKQPIEKPT
ncbi:MAG: flotillin-like protein FloA [Planctomycetes bacterium]|nr:flotillin-like protein FloA [Planctomycetota bacterium]